MKTAHVRPIGGRKIRFPDRPSQHLRPEGDRVNLDDFWRARLADGDVEVVEPRAKPAPAPRKARAPTPPATQE